MRMMMMKLGKDLLLPCFFVWIIYSSVTSAERLTLGYITGSRRRYADDGYDRPGYSMSGAITMAVNEINNNPLLLPNHTLTFMVGETYGESGESLKHTAQFVWNRNIDAIIGPQETCVCDAKLASAFNLPMISYFCPATEVSNKFLYTTFARTRPPDFQVSKSVASLLRHFNWNRVIVLSSDTERFRIVVDTIIKILKASGVTVADHRSWQGTYYFEYVRNPFIKIIDETYLKTRIYVAVGEYHEYVGLMTYMQEKGLFNDGDYFVVGVHLGQYKPEDPQKYIRSPFQSAANGMTAEAYRSYFGVIGSPAVYPQFARFSRTVNMYLEMPPFNFTSPFKLMKKIRPEAAYLYDAVYLYARAAHQALINGTDPRDGVNLINFIRGQTYTSAMGYTTYIDENADAQGNYTLISLQRLQDDPKKFGLLPIGQFELVEEREDGDLLGLPHIHLREDNLQWIGEAPPVAVPPCSLLDEECQERNRLRNVQDNPPL